MSELHAIAKIGYIVKDKNRENTFLLYVRKEAYTEWVHTEWKDCCKIYQKKSYAEKIAQKVGGEVLKVEYGVDELGTIPGSVKVVA